MGRVVSSGSLSIGGLVWIYERTESADALVGNEEKGGGGRKIRKGEGGALRNRHEVRVRVALRIRVLESQGRAG